MQNSQQFLPANQTCTETTLGSAEVQGTNNRRQNIDAIEKNSDFIQANDIRSLVDLLD